MGSQDTWGITGQACTAGKGSNQLQLPGKPTPNLGGKTDCVCLVHAEVLLCIPVCAHYVIKKSPEPLCISFLLDISALCGWEGGSATIVTMPYGTGSP